MVGMAWNELQDILAEILAQLGVCLWGGVPKFWPSTELHEASLSSTGLH